MSSQIRIFARSNFVRKYIIIIGLIYLLTARIGKDTIFFFFG